MQNEFINSALQTGPNKLEIDPIDLCTRVKLISCRLTLTRDPIYPELVIPVNSMTQTRT